MEKFAAMASRLYNHVGEEGIVHYAQINSDFAEYVLFDSEFGKYAEEVGMNKEAFGPIAGFLGRGAKYLGGKLLPWLERGGVAASKAAPEAGSIMSKISPRLQAAGKWLSPRLQKAEQWGAKAPVSSIASKNIMTSVPKGLKNVKGVQGLGKTVGKQPLQMSNISINHPTWVNRARAGGRKMVDLMDKPLGWGIFGAGMEAATGGDIKDIAAAGLTGLGAGKVFNMAHGGIGKMKMLQGPGASSIGKWALPVAGGLAASTVAEQTASPYVKQIIGARTPEQRMADEYMKAIQAQMLAAQKLQQQGLR